MHSARFKRDSKETALLGEEPSKSRAATTTTDRQRAHRSCTCVCVVSYYCENLRQDNTALAGGLGSTDPCSSAVDMEPWSRRHSSRLLTRVLATTTKICNTDGSSRTHVQPSTRIGTPPYSSRHRDLKFWRLAKPLVPRRLCFGREL